MRALLVFSIVAFASLSAASLRAEAAGAYETLSAANAGACARRCADDGLCVSWAYRSDGACELHATGTRAAEAGVATGVSARAPDFLRSAAPAPPGAAVMIASVGAEEPAREPAPAAEDPLVAELLGGPEDEASGIRPRLGN